MLRSRLLGLVVGLAASLVLAGCGGGGVSGSRSLGLSSGGSSSGAAGSFTHYVDAVAGSDTGSGSRFLPFQTITKALSLAKAGDRIRVLPGTYNQALGESFPIVVPAGVEIIGDEVNRGAGSPPTKIIGAGQAPGYSAGFISTVLAPGASSTVAGFIITSDASAGATFPMNIVIQADGVIIRDNRVVNGPKNGIYIDDTHSGSAKNLVFRNNVIAGNLGVGLIFRQGGEGSIVEQNQITDNKIGVEFDFPAGDLGGGTAGSAGGNVFSCNSDNDVWTTRTIAIDALNNLWDHVPPTQTVNRQAGFDIYLGSSGSIDTTGHATSPTPCP